MKNVLAIPKHHTLLRHDGTTHASLSALSTSIDFL